LPLTLLVHSAIQKLMNPELQSLVSDIAVAMFKVSSIIRHATLKAELENKAISLVSSPNSDTIINATNLIVFAREVGEIKPSNVAILIRELEALRKGLFVLPAAEEIDISSNFTARNLDANDVASFPLPTKTENPKLVSNLDKTINSPTLSKNFFNPDKVYQYIVARKGTKLKELESAFNTVSGRTIRRITDSLIKEGKIERVGNPGPTSFYRVPASTSVSDKQQTTNEKQALSPATPSAILTPPPTLPPSVISLPASTSAAVSLPTPAIAPAPAIAPIPTPRLNF